MQNDVRIRDYINIALKNYNWCWPTIYHEGTKLQIPKIFSQILPLKTQLVTNWVNPIHTQTNANPSRPIKDHLDPKFNAIGDTMRNAFRLSWLCPKNELHRMNQQQGAYTEISF